MLGAIGSVTSIDQRETTRELVNYRAQASGPDNQALSLLVVNISPQGMMARTDTEYAVGSSIRVSLPGVGVVSAEIRWSLGGRIGCNFETAIERKSYYELLATVQTR